MNFYEDGTPFCSICRTVLDITKPATRFSSYLEPLCQNHAMARVDGPTKGLLMEFNASCANLERIKEQNRAELAGRIAFARSEARIDRELRNIMLLQAATRRERVRS